MNGTKKLRAAGLGVVLLLGVVSCARVDVSPKPEVALSASALPAGVKGPSNSDGNPVTPKRTANVRGPVPTNDWWSSLVFQRFAGNPYSETMHAHPLSLKAKASGLGIAYPATHVITPDQRKYEYTYTEDFTLGVAGLSSPDAKLDGYTDWTVRAFWSGGGSSLTATFGHGLPYVYATKTGGDAQVAFNGAPSVWSNASNVVGVSIRGRRGDGDPLGEAVGGDVAGEREHAPLEPRRENVLLRRGAAGQQRGHARRVRPARVRLRDRHARLLRRPERHRHDDLQRDDDPHGGRRNPAPAGLVPASVA